MAREHGENSREHFLFVLLLVQGFHHVSLLALVAACDFALKTTSVWWTVWFMHRALLPWLENGKTRSTLPGTLLLCFFSHRWSVRNNFKTQFIDLRILHNCPFFCNQSFRPILNPTHLAVGHPATTPLVRLAPNFDLFLGKPVCILTERCNKKIY